MADTNNKNQEAFERTFDHIYQELKNLGKVTS
jgi:hypothetical protein